VSGKVEGQLPREVSEDAVDQVPVFLLSALLNPPPPTSAANSAGAKKSDKQLVLVVD